jgi:hypothetical protein
MDNPQAMAILQEMKWALSSRVWQVAAAVWLSCLVSLVTRVRHELGTFHSLLLDLIRHVLMMSPHNTLYVRLKGHDARGQEEDDCGTADGGIANRRKFFSLWLQFDV